MRFAMDKMPQQTVTRQDAENTLPNKKENARISAPMGRQFSTISRG